MDANRKRRTTIRRRLPREQRERLILSAATRLFLKKGYVATGVNTIADAARVNVGTVYYYFPSKSRLLFELISRAAREFLDLTKSIVESGLPPTERLRHVVDAVINWEVARGGIIGLGVSERSHLPPKLRLSYAAQRDEIEMLYLELVGDVLMEHGVGNTDPKISTRLMLSMLTSITRWYKPDGELTPDAIASLAYGFITVGLFGSGSRNGNVLPRT
jgi:AcrR family transcriptional regulator